MRSSSFGSDPARLPVIFKVLGRDSALNETHVQSIACSCVAQCDFVARTVGTRSMPAPICSICLALHGLGTRCRQQ